MGGAALAARGSGRRAIAKLYWPTYFTMHAPRGVRDVDDVLALRFETREPDDDEVDTAPAVGVLGGLTVLRIVRVLAPNPDVYTLEGTNTWVVGE